MANFKHILIFLLATSFSFGLFASHTLPEDTAAKKMPSIVGGLYNMLDFSIEKQNILFTKQAMVWSNANTDARIFGLNENQEEIELGTRGATQVEAVVYENLYFNIDLIVHIPSSNDRREISYEFVVYPGGNPADITLDFNSGYIRPGGEAFLLDDETESLRLSAPEAIQVAAGTDEQSVVARFSATGNKLQLSTEDYEQSQVLTLVCKQL